MKKTGKYQECLALGKQIAHLRKEITKLSQDDFALQAGLDRTYISSIERGERNATLMTLVKIANALEVPVSELVKTLPSKK